MEIVENSAESLSRQYAIKVSHEELSERLDEKIKEIQPKVNLKGFRPGKVPATHIRKVFGESMMEDVIQSTISEASQKAITDKELRTASQPQIQLKSKMKKIIAGEPLNFDLNIDLMPEFELKPLDDLKLEKLVAKMDEAERDEKIAELAKAHREYKERAATQKAKEEDRVVIDFKGFIDGEAFEGGEGTQQQVTIGSGQFIPGFEEGIVGLKKGDETKIKVTFPEEYASADLAGKDAEFEIKVHKVEARKKAPSVKTLAENLGFEGEEQLYERIEELASTELASLSHQKLKRALLDKLDEQYDFELPPRMVEQEFDAIWKQVQNDPEFKAELEKEDGDEEKLKKEYEAIAQRRVKLGLVLAEIGREQKIEVSNEELSHAIVNEAQRYPGSEEQIIEFYRKDEQAQMQLRAPIFEEKVVQAMLGKIEVTEKEVSREELEKEDESPYLD